MTRGDGGPGYETKRPGQHQSTKLGPSPNARRFAKRWWQRPPSDRHCVRSGQ